MKRSEIYRNAARRIERKQNTYSCVAIEMACKGRDYEDAKEFYGETMSPRGDGVMYSFDFLDEEYADEFDKQFARDHRVVTLCFMAAIAEDAEKRKRK